jgi:hypothetical protein
MALREAPPVTLMGRQFLQTGALRDRRSQAGAGRNRKRSEPNVGAEISTNLNAESGKAHPRGARRGRR